MDVKALAKAKFGITLKKIGREWHGPCPFCGAGRDRFMAWEEKGNFWCRHCDKKGFLVDSHKQWIPPEDYLIRIRDQQEADRKQRAHDLMIWQEKLKPQTIIGWHEALTQEHRSLFNSQGIRDILLDSFSVGYVKDKVISYQGKFIKVQSYTIPIVSPYTKKIVNIQFRLIDPPEGVGRYRQVMDIPQANFYVSDQTSGNVVYVVEGAKKAMVFADFTGMRSQVIGLPGINPHIDIIDELKCFDRIIFIPDPIRDYRRIKSLIERFASRLKNVYLVNLIDKPDDMIARGEITLNQLNRIIEMSRKIC